MTGWQAYIPWRSAIAEVLDPRFYTLEWLDGEVTAERARVWASDSAVIVAQVREYPAGGKEVHGLVAAGDLAGVVALIPLAEEWGRSQGCVVAGIDSREGWARVMADHGYSVYQVALRKEL